MLPQPRTGSLLHALVETLSASEPAVGWDDHHIPFDIDDVAEQDANLAMPALPDDYDIGHRSSK